MHISIINNVKVFFFFKNHREWEKKQGLPPVDSLLQGPGLGHVEARWATWTAVFQPLGQFSDAFLDTLSGSWTKHGAVGT